MDIGSSFTFVTQDEEWVKKILIAAVLVLTGIGSLAVTGWALEIARRVINDEEETLPEWSEIGQYFISGLKIVAATLVWVLPIILIAGCIGGIGVVGGEQFASGDDAATFILIMYGCMGVLIFLYSILVGLHSPALLGALADGASFSEAINPSRAFQLFRANMGGFVIAWLVSGLAMSVLGMLGTLICFVGVFPATAYGYAVWGHMIGQAYRDAKSLSGMMVKGVET